MKHAPAWRSGATLGLGAAPQSARFAADGRSRRHAARWAGPAFLALLAATLPLLAPPGPRAAGWIPDLAALAVVAAGFRATPDRAAIFGVVIGMLASLWTPEPVLLRPFLFGAAGYAAAHVAINLDRDRATVRMASAALVVLLVRGAEFVAAALAGAGPSTSADAGQMVRTALTSAIVAALVAPLWIGVVARWRLLGPLERSFRDV